MAYDPALADRISDRLDHRPSITSKRMFGGKMWWLNGNACCGIDESSLIIKVLPETAEELLHQPGVERFAPAGKPMKGWLVIGPESIDAEDQLDAWIAVALDHAKSLPPKSR